MRAVFVLVLSLLATVSCNAVLDIPERPLAALDDADGTDDGTVDGAGDSGTASDEGTDSSVLGEAPEADSGFEESSADSTTDAAIDTSLPDAGPTDSIVTAPKDPAPDAASDAATCGVIGRPCCGYTPTSCDTNSVCSSGNCVAATGACVRASDCPDEVCGGPTLCAGNVCTACTTSSGTKASWAKCASSSECASGLCDPVRGECTHPCAIAITGKADCAGFGADVCAEGKFGGSGSGTVGFCARGCAHDSVCATGEVCRSFANETTNHIDVTCATTGGTVEYGITCSSNTDCRGGICLSWSTGKYCANFCTTGADCTYGTLKTCSGVSFAKPKSGTQIVNVCTP